MTAGLVDCASAFPEHIVDNAFFGGCDSSAGSGMFAGTVRRRHLAPGQSASDLIVQAAGTLLDRHGVDPTQVDAIFTNVSLPDQFFYGCGAEVKRRLGADTDRIIDLHNSGCVSFVYMLELATAMIDAGQIDTALICNAQTAGGRLFALPQNRARPESAVPGDGCGVGLVQRGGSPVLGIVSRCYGDHACDMRTVRDCGTPYWQAAENELRIDFAPENVRSIIQRGNDLVPGVIREVCEKTGRDPGAIDVLITNQPNLKFLRRWHESLGLEPERHIHTFQEYANLFGAAIPVNLEHGLRTRAVKDGDLVCLAGFSHAGDYAAAALVEWRACAPVAVSA